MKSYKNKCRSAFVFVVVLLMIAACAALVVTIVPMFQSPKEVETTYISPSAVPDTVHHGIVPTLLTIPKLDLSAPVENVGVSTENTIMTPQSFNNVGWYKYSAQPGNPGAALFVGHVNRAGGFSAVFTHLNITTIGDVIEVSDGTTTLRYKVVKVMSVDYTDALFVKNALALDDSSYVILITCEGDWIAEKHTYDKRLAVIAKLEM